MTDLPRRFSRVLSVTVLVLILLAALAACHKSEEAAPAAGAAQGGGTPPAAAPAAAPAAPQAPAVPLKVVALAIGKAVGPDNKVTTEVDTFAPADAFYVSVGTTGSSPGAKLTARWASVSHSGAEKPAGEETKTIAPAGDAATEFHLARPEGWPTGDYKIEILLDGQSVATKAFRVAK